MPHNWRNRCTEWNVCSRRRERKIFLQFRRNRNNQRQLNSFDDFAGQYGASPTGRITAARGSDSERFTHCDGHKDTHWITHAERLTDGYAEWLTDGYAERLTDRDAEAHGYSYYHRDAEAHGYSHYNSNAKSYSYSHGNSEWFA
jgi:hypothetical protein